MQESTNRADLTIAVYRWRGNSFRVAPGEALSAHGSTVAWENLTDRPVELKFVGGSDKIFEPAMDTLELEPGERSDPVRISESAQRDVHQYVVTVVGGRGVSTEFAEGGSYPRMIVIR